MRRAGRWILGILAAWLTLFALLLIVANTPLGRTGIERTLIGMTAGEVKLTGIAGRFPDALRLSRLELSDSTGPWLVIDNVILDWSPWRLLFGELSINRLEAGQIAVQRLPQSESNPPPPQLSLPLALRLDSLRVIRLELAEAVLGKPLSFSIVGKVLQGEVDLNAKRLDGEGTYHLNSHLDPANLQAHLSVQEPTQGLLAAVADLQAFDALTLEASAEGRWSDLQTRLELSFGPLRASAQGRLDIEHETIAELTVNATAPAMRPRPGLSWQAMTLDAQIHGRFTQPVALGKLRVDGLNAAGASIHRIALDMQGDAGRLGWRGELAGLRLPDQPPGLWEAVPVQVQASIQLDATQRPVQFKLNHPLLVAEGKAVTAGENTLDLRLDLPDLKPYAALGGWDVQGKTSLNVRVDRQADTARLSAEGTLAVTGGAAPWPALLGNAAKLGINAEWRGEDVKLSRFTLDGKALTLAADGALVSRLAQFKWKLALIDAAAVLAGGSGRMAAQGRIDGPWDKLTVTADVDGDIATRQFPHGPVRAKLRLDGLPYAPTGEITARAVLAASPLELALTAQAPADGSLRLAIRRADWKSAHAQGGLNLAKGSAWPVGKIDMNIGSLADLKTLIGLPLSGAMTATLDTTAENKQPLAKLKLDAKPLGLTGTATAAHAHGELAISDPLSKPAIDGRLKLDGFSAGPLSGSAGLELTGPVEALKLRLSAQLPNLAGSELRLDSTANLDTKLGQLALTDGQAQWKNETLRLLAPTRLAFKNGLALDRLRLGLRQAELELTGQVSPKLNLDASLRELDVGLVALFAPDFIASGTLNAEAKLGGAVSRPAGTITAVAKQLRLRNGPARSLPPLNLIADAKLNGASAQIDGKLDAGREFTLNLSGETALSAAGPVDLHAVGSTDLKILDSWLNAAGRRLRGQLALDVALTGAVSAPQATGILRMTEGEVQDYANGVHISDINALLESAAGKVHISKLQGRAGSGTIAVNGDVDLIGEDVPVNLNLSAHNARPLVGDRLNVDLSADLTVNGHAQGALAVAGAVHLKRAEIRIPEKLPASIAVLKVRRPGETPKPPTPGHNSEIALNLAIDAPGQVFVRGRGLDAELGGKIHLRGTTAKPQPDGGFALRHGEFNLAGQRLLFSKGEVGFDGGSLVDPSLDFLAKTASASVTAFLNVGGTANKPKITLSSIPDLPQDEVLAQLLFGRAATNLSPMEMLQTGVAVASLSGVTSVIGDPLDSVRKTLGLDRLSVGTSLEAGRYIAPGIYLGAKQGVSGSGTQATVQIDIAKGLKIEGAVGAAASGGTSGPAGANSVGVVYQYEY